MSRLGFELQTDGQKYDIFNCNWVATRWQQYSTHLHTNNTGNVTKQTIRRTTPKIHRTTRTIHRTTQKYIEQHEQYIEQHKNLEECGPCPVFAGFTLAFALQLRKKHGKTSVRVVRHKHTIRIRIHRLFLALLVALSRHQTKKMHKRLPYIFVS